MIENPTRFGVVLKPRPVRIAKFATPSVEVFSMLSLREVPVSRSKLTVALHVAQPAVVPSYVHVCDPPTRMVSARAVDATTASAVQVARVTIAIRNGFTEAVSVGGMPPDVIAIETPSADGPVRLTLQALT